MPAYPWLHKTVMNGNKENIAANMRVLRIEGVPYTDDDIAKANAMIDGKTEEDAVVAYLQQLGTVLK
jgi:cytochrome c oxidase cbb3-type subunit 2